MFEISRIFKYSIYFLKFIAVLTLYSLFAIAISQTFIVNFLLQQAALHNFIHSNFFIVQKTHSKKVSQKSGIMGIIKDRFKAKAEKVSAGIKELLKEHGNKVIGEVQLSQVYQGMRGMTGLVTETSLLDPQEGIRFRGYSIPQLREKLTKAPNGSEPLPEGLFYLMLVGELPSDDDVHHISSVWQRRSHVPCTAGSNGTLRAG